MIERFANTLGNIASGRDETLNYHGEKNSNRFKLESKRGLSARLLVFGSLTLLPAAIGWFGFESYVGIGLGCVWLCWLLLQEWLYPISIFVNAEPENNVIEITTQRVFIQQVRRLRLDSFNQLEVYADYTQAPDASGLFQFVLCSSYERLPISLFVVITEKNLYYLEQDIRNRLTLKKSHE